MSDRTAAVARRIAALRAIEANPVPPPVPDPWCRTCGFHHPPDPAGCPRWRPEGE